MQINNFIRHHMVKLGNQQTKFQALQPNQIVKGTIVKLFPNNQALIQIGQEQRLAQLDTALAVGEKYYFQVVKNDQYIHLKVLGEPIQQEMATNITALIEQLNIPADRQLRQFIQHLIERQIPFDRHTLLQSLPLLSLNHQKENNFQVIEQMIVKQLPLTKETFLSIQTFQEESFSQLLKGLDSEDIQQVLRESPRGAVLENAIQSLIRPDSNQQFVHHLLQVVKENPKIAQLLQSLHVLTGNQARLEQPLLTLLAEQDNLFQLGQSQLYETIQGLVSQKEQIIPEIKNLLARWGGEAPRSPQEPRVFNPQSLAYTRGELPLFREQVEQVLSSFLPREQLQLVLSSIGDPENIPQLLTALQTLTEEASFTQLNQVLNEPFTAKAEFLQQVEHMLRLVGLDYEQMIQEGRVADQPATLKQSLMQMIQQQLPLDQERAQQLLHFINGMQLQSVEETNHFIYSSFLLPGEKLNLNSDLYMQFQSKKTEDKKIDPNHCRILFFLDLHRIEHTIVDMNVQDRVISITVYNNHHFLKSLVQPFEQRLKTRLKKMEFQLSSITYKEIEEDQINQAKSHPQPFIQKDYSGVDFRI